MRPRKSVSITFTEPTMTKQNHKAECDINNILAKHQKTGLISHVAAAGGSYQDLPNDLDYQAALNLVMEAQASFDALPSTVRREMDNDPAKFLAFVENSENVERMAELGLVNAPEEEPELPLEPAPPAPEQ